MLANWYFYFQVPHLGFHQIQFEIKVIFADAKQLLSMCVLVIRGLFCD